MSSNRERGTDPFDRFNDDPTRHKHGGTDTSNAAWKKARRGRAQCQQEVLDVLRRAYPQGMTGKEIAAALGKPFHAVSGRITELLEENLVTKSAEIRNGGRVILAGGVPELPLEAPLRDPATLAQQKAEIVRLVDAEDFWGAVRVAYENNIGIRLVMPEVTI